MPSHDVKDLDSTRALVVILVVVWFVLPWEGCSARRSEPIAGPLPITSAAVAQGQKVFMAKCHQCHPGGEAGLGPALNDKPMPNFLIRFQVRNGLGAMPAFSEQDISDEELEQVLVYLKALRAHG